MQIERRTFLRYLCSTGLGLLTSACAAEVPATPVFSPAISKAPTVVPTILRGASSVSPEGNHWFDTRLTQENHPLLRSVEFYFDPRYEGGSLAMEICFQPATSGEYRIISRQENQNPGYLFNRPFDIIQPCVLTHPVIKVEPDEMDKVIIGTRRYDQPHDSTYRGRVYRVTRAGNSLNIAVLFAGIEEVDPEGVKPRDPNAVKDYFKR